MQELVDGAGELFGVLGRDEHTAASPQRDGQPFHGAGEDRHPQAQGQDGTLGPGFFPGRDDVQAGS